MLSLYPVAEAELGWYFTQGETLLGGSSCMGPMLEHVATYYVPRESDWRAKVTVFPMHDHRQSEGWEPDDNLLHRFGRVSRRLRDAGVRMSEAPAVLSAYFGEEGDRFGRTKMGRIAAVLRFTSAGQELIKRQRKKQRGTTQKASDAQQVENAVSLASAGSEAAQIFQLGVRQAQELLARALRAYVNKEGPTCLAEAAE